MLKIAEKNVRNTEWLVGQPLMCDASLFMSRVGAGRWGTLSVENEGD